jgi:HEAT repeat protein
MHDVDTIRRTALPLSLRRPQLPTADVGLATVVALGRMGKEGVVHAGAVAARLTDGASDVRRAAVEALGRMGKEGAVHAGAVAARLSGDESTVWTQVRRATVEALGLMGKEGAVLTIS